jgi:hypothetical protein
MDEGEDDDIEILDDDCLEDVDELDDYIYEDEE